MKRLLFLLCALRLSQAVSQTVSGLPLHTDSKDPEGLRGPRELIKGESVLWLYPFDWTVTSRDGWRVTLKKYNCVTFIGRVANGFVIESNGKTYTVPKPPNTGSEQKLFALADIRIQGTAAEIVKNRLGPPTEVLTGPDGTAYLYREIVTATRKTFDTAHSTTEGTIGRDRFKSTTTTEIPILESMTYSPYSFVIYFNAEGKVSRVEDRVKGAAEWKRR